MTTAQLEDAVQGITAFTVTALKARAREVIDLVAEGKAVAIVRHKVADAALISAADYVEFMKLRRERLNFLTQRYDDLVALMQAPESAAGVDAPFNDPGALDPGGANRAQGRCEWPTHAANPPSRSSSTDHSHGPRTPGGIRAAP